MARARSDLPHDFPDRAIRDALLHGDNLRALIRAVAPDLEPYLDFSRIEVVQKPYFLDDWRQRENDLLVRLPFRDNDRDREILVCILLEHQSTVDQAMPLRMLLYAVLFWEQEWRAYEEHHERGQRLRLTPVLPVVLYTGADAWDSNRLLGELFEAPEVWRAWLPAWQMPLWDLSTHSAEELVTRDEGWWQALAVVRAERLPPDEFLAIFSQALQRLEALGERSPVRWQQLLRMVLSWGLYRRPRREHERLRDAARSSHHNVQLQQEVETVGQQLEKTWMEELLEEGEARGLTRGKELGQLQALRQMLERQLQQRFQTVPPELHDRIQNAPMEHLQAAFDQLWTIHSLDELQL